MLHFLSLILSDIITNLVASQSPSVLKGGLVYSEEYSLGPINLNQDHVNFIRTIDTSALQKSAQAIKDLTTLYYTFCCKVGNQITPFDKPIPSLQDNEPTKTEELVFSPVNTTFKKVYKYVEVWELDYQKSETETLLMRFGLLQSKKQSKSSELVFITKLVQQHFNIIVTTNQVTMK